jgi:hypothetical protein
VRNDITPTATKSDPESTSTPSTTPTDAERSYSLVELPLEDASTGTTADYPAEINGQAFPRSIHMPPGIYGDAVGRAEYSLRRRCMICEVFVLAANDVAH